MHSVRRAGIEDLAVDILPVETGDCRAGVLSIRVIEKSIPSLFRSALAVR